MVLVVLYQNIQVIYLIDHKRYVFLSLFLFLLLLLLISFNELLTPGYIYIYIYIYIYLFISYILFHICIVYIYQNDKEIKPSCQVLRVSCKRLLQSCVQWNNSFFRQAVQGILVPRFTKISPKNTLSSVRLVLQES